MKTNSSRTTLVTVMAAFLSFIVCVFFVASGLFALNAQQQFKDGDLDLLYE